ncbi:MAG: parB-like partition protein [Bryobacterales bacterium]|nr:parB-like partition protein [Bryobacterales bacterium]
MTNTIEIPLNKLVPFAGNVRKTHNKRFIAELAASIREHGLQQNLTVKPLGKKFAVVAGGQRFLALMQLAKEGDIAPNYLVTCKIANDDYDPAEIGLVENVMREDMHPADQFEAFRDLVDKGVSAVDIAARFGKSLDHVNRLLKLARVSPAVLKAYRADTLTLQQVMAFTVSDDHAAQDQVLKNLRPNQRDPRTIRDALTENEIPASDRRVKFVTLKAYEKAGGQKRTDLFTEGDDSIFILDPALLDRLLKEKLAGVTQELAKEGWKWTDAYADFGYEQRSQFRGIHPAPAPLPRKLAKEVESLKAEYESLAASWEEAGEEAEYPDRLAEIRERLDEIERSREREWTPEQLAMAGAIAIIGKDGKIGIERGFVRPEDMPKEGKKAKAAQTVGPDGQPGGESRLPDLSAALTESLSAHKSAALAAELAAQPDIALAVVVHGLAARVLLDVSVEKRGLQIAAHPQSLHRIEGSKAFERMEAERKNWREAIPKSADALWAWCLEQKQETLLKLLAFCAAATVNAVQGKSDRPEGDRLKNAAALAMALKLDMKAWFAPDAANYFTRIAKPRILDALKEGRNQPNAPAWEKLKKPELAALAERELAGKGWLPEMLRTAA